MYYMNIEMEQKGERADRHGSNRGVSQPVTPTLSDLGIKPMQSHRWQQIAQVPVAIKTRNLRNMTIDVSAL